ncbi:MAG: hypothetical protein ACYC44_05370, partial [Patescibacteria group bacterium]
EQVFREMLNELKDPLRNIEFAPGDESPRFLIVVPTGLVSLLSQCHLISWEGRNVRAALFENELSVISNGRPHCLPYLAVQIDMGCDYRPLSTEEYSTYINGTGQSPFYTEELLALLRCKPPAMLEGKFFCANMRHGADKQAVYLQRGTDNFELKTMARDIVDKDHRFPSCTKRLYITKKPICINGSPASLD